MFLRILLKFFKGLKMVEIIELDEMDEHDRDNLKKVLVIDDEKFIVQLVEEVIKGMEGYFVKITSNSKEGFEFAKKYSFNLIMIDHFMPGLIGSEFITKIREGDGPNKSVPFLVCSGDPEQVSEIHKDGEKITVMAKPLKIPTFVAHLEQILG